jgi:hypothetical protein
MVRIQNAMSNSWVAQRDRLRQEADRRDRTVIERINLLTELFFHFGQDRHEAAKVVREIQDLTRADYSRSS